MAYLIAQGDSNLYKIDLSTGVATQLTLPTGVTLSSAKKPKFAVLNQWVAMVNSPSRNLVIDPEGTVRVMVPRPPMNAPVTAAGSGTGLTGAYLYKVSYVVLNSDGELLQESPLGQPSTSLTLTNQNVNLTRIPLSSDDGITARRLYRTLAGATVYFQVADVDGNTNESFVEGAADATVTLLPSLSASLVAPPGTLPGIRFKNIVEWKSRFWAVADDPALVDTVYVSETNKVYAWPNSLVAYPTGQDAVGIVGFAPRKNQLGLIKRSGVWMVSASSSGTGVSITNVSVSQIAFGKAGSISPETIVVINDKVYWLGNDGVYEWSDSGVNNVSDDSVKPWFQTDTYFNRTRFANAFAKYNPVNDCYELHLAAVGSSTEDRWVSFCLSNKNWYGPHKTGAFTPSHATSLVDNNGLPVVLVGGTDGVVYVANQTTFKDGASSAIDFDCYGPFHHGEAPDISHVWLEFSMHSKVQSGGTLTVTPYVGGLDAAAGTDISHDMTTGRQRLRRLGTGRMVRFRMRENTLNQGLALYGYEIPYFEAGRR